ncbi:MAG: serpin family protein [Henriciella sp.]|nr:serpin family protein [Henriciella sp.]
MKSTHSIAALIALSAAGCVSAPSPYETTLQTKSVVDGNLALGLDLYRQTSDTPETDNIFVSPASISTALAMTYAGARDETATEMAETLHFALPEDEFHTTMGEVLSGVQQSDGANRLRINNRIFVDKRVVVEPDFAALVKETYKAPQKKLDFRTQFESAREAINDWVAEKTEDRILDLLSPSNVHECTRMVLVNTIYLDAKWAQPFKGGMTGNEEFTSWVGEKTDLRMMNQTAHFKYLKRPGFKALELPYLNDDLSMVVFLPDAEDGLSKFEEKMTVSRVDQWINMLAASEPERVKVKLPKIEMKQRLQLKEALKSLGMVNSFTGKAEFSGIADPSKNPNEPCFSMLPLKLKIDDVVHQTFLEIDEEGTEAAAATAVVMVAVSGGRRPIVEPKEFYADHPFFFVIKDNTTGLILFMGRFVTPPK